MIGTAAQALTTTPGIGAALLARSMRYGLAQDLFARVPIQAMAHLGGGIVAIVTGAVQVETRRRARFPPADRRTGCATRSRRTLPARRPANA